MRRVVLYAATLGLFVVMLGIQTTPVGAARRPDGGRAGVAQPLLAAG